MKKIELGKVILDLIPDQEHGNPRNSEGAFFTLDNGDILFAYSRYKGKDHSDHAEADISLLCSHDDGVTFGEERVILTCEQENAVNIMSVSFLPLSNGDIGLFYLVRTTYTLLQMYMRRSGDGGETWSERILCTPYEGFFVVNNDRVIRLSNGRLLISAARHYAAKEHFDSRSEAVFFFSDDDGVTWKIAATSCSMPFAKYSKSGLQEPGAIELEPGTVWAWARTDLGRQYEMYSYDFGNTWTACQPSFFTSPLSPLSMKRDARGDIWAIWNPIPDYNGKEKDLFIFDGGRNPYAISKSINNGRSFFEPLAFEQEAGHGYCYCAIHFTKTAMLLAYCAGGAENGSCLAKTRIRRIPIEELNQLFSNL